MLLRKVVDVLAICVNYMFWGIYENISWRMGVTVAAIKLNLCLHWIIVQRKGA